MKSLCLLLLLLVHTAAGANAGELELVGKARLEVFVWPVYESRLYAPGGEYSPQQRPLRLEVTYLRDISTDQLVDRTQKEWRHLGLEHPQQKQWLARLGELWPDVAEDDTLTLELDGDDQSRFLLNGEPLGGIDDPAFGDHFLAIWLSPDTSRPNLRRDLLGM